MNDCGLSDECFGPLSMGWTWNILIWMFVEMESDIPSEFSLYLLHQHNCKISICAEYMLAFLRPLKGIQSSR